MVQLTLPKGSAPKKGKTWPKPEGKNVKKFKVYRYSPEEGGNPRWDTYFVCLLYTSPSPRDGATSRMPSSA